MGTRSKTLLSVPLVAFGLGLALWLRPGPDRQMAHATEGARTLEVTHWSDGPTRETSPTSQDVVRMVFDEGAFPAVVARVRGRLPGWREVPVPKQRGVAFWWDDDSPLSQWTWKVERLRSVVHHGSRTLFLYPGEDGRVHAERKVNTWR